MNIATPRKEVAKVRLVSNFIVINIAQELSIVVVHIHSSVAMGEQHAVVLNYANQINVPDGNHQGKHWHTLQAPN